MSPSSSRRPAAADMTRIALFAVLLAICAWISLPLPPIPVTLQTFALFSALLFLGGRRGTCAVAVYLLMGAVGLPVFSGFRSGLGVLLEATGGYLLGFLATALIYWAITARTNQRAAIPACLLGLLGCYTFGTVWYLLLYSGASAAGLPAILASCVLPFLLPDLVKLALACLLAKRLKPILKL